ncbi:MAG TPA: amino acid deaminase/aldolase [Streptosporangiaceae bacterium]|nr:amino acid deaminase/aldolase [Streptosporangiaceae bacterium]
MELRRRYDAATADVEPPLAIVDMEALRANAADLVRRAAGKPIRVASKSVRCRAILEEILAMDGFAGIMAFTLPEALWLAGHGASDDILVAYPTADRTALAALAADPKAAATVTVVVDSADHLDLIDKAAGDHPVRVCLDLDAAYRALGGRLRVGARRSPVHTPEQAAELAEEIGRRPGLVLTGIMAYEAQIAGVGDDPPGRPLRARAIRLLQARSGTELARRRAEVVRAVREVCPGLEFVNGGGTGSVEKTTAEDAVTEVAAGSGLYHSTLFDHYTNFTGRPAALFALPVVRRPGPGVVTCLGGGYPASGNADRNRLPQPYLPAGLSYDSAEGAGEVQTPLLGPAADTLGVGDRVWFRHAKAGELCERFAALHIVEGDRITRTVPTYRGEGQTFL